jgi:hypothetical protein
MPSSSSALPHYTLAWYVLGEIRRDGYNVISIGISVPVMGNYGHLRQQELLKPSNAAVLEVLYYLIISYGRGLEKSWNLRVAK